MICEGTAMTKEERRRLNNVLYTLGKIPVCGKDNLDMLLGCIQELESIIKEAPDGEQNQAGEQRGV